MDEFARLPAAERGIYVDECAARRDLTSLVIEKDFWVCWTLRRLVGCEKLGAHITFKGGTSLSKAYGVIARFSEDIDLTIRRSAPLVDAVVSPMEPEIGTKERRRRTAALKAAAQSFVADIAMPALSKAIEESLGRREGWSLEMDPDDSDRQTLLFNYPRSTDLGDTSGSYIKPRVKLEFGARGDPEPFEDRSITPYLAEEFPQELPAAATSVPTLSVARTYWEKATILHALHHNGKLRDGMSRHYYDLLMLDIAEVTSEAMQQPDLLALVVKNKTIMFADKSASYENAVLGQMRLMPTDVTLDRLKSDYAAMADMFMTSPPSFEELMEGLVRLEAKLNDAPGRNAGAGAV
jgi:hypothetical protein